MTLVVILSLRAWETVLGGKEQKRKGKEHRLYRLVRRGLQRGARTPLFWVERTGQVSSQGPSRPILNLQPHAPPFPPLSSPDQQTKADQEGASALLKGGRPVPAWLVTALDGSWSPLQVLWVADQ